MDSSRAREALLAAYPDKISISGDVQNNDYFAVGGTPFRWAGGALLPVSIASGQYTPHPFYPYRDQLPELAEPTPEQQRRIENRVAAREASPPARSPAFYDAIWRIKDQASAWRQVKTAFFFGRKLLVHRDLLDELASIEEELTAYLDVDADLKAFINALSIVEGYNWRAIAGTASRSYHSYGVAIDFLPSAGESGETYWRWAKDRHEQWYVLPYEERYMPPERFIRAFEKRGFIWGGKWFYWDTMHFEYRPEILALNGYTRIQEINAVTGVREQIWIPPYSEN